MAIQDNCL